MGSQKMYSSSYSSYGSRLGSSLSSRSALPALPSTPPYSSPYSGYSRYRDYSNSRYGDISAYPTPVNYSQLTRGSSLQDVSPSYDSPSWRLTRQSSLDQPKRSLPPTHRLHYEQAYQDLVRSRRTTTA